MTANTVNENETRDSILDGSITLIQPKHGYRFSVEAILLGRFARASTRDRVLELGAGCGVVSVMISALYRPREVVAIEIQPSMAEMIQRSAVINGLKSVRAVCADLRQKKSQASSPRASTWSSRILRIAQPVLVVRVPTTAGAWHALKAILS